MKVLRLLEVGQKAIWICLLQQASSQKTPKSWISNAHNRSKKLKSYNFPSETPKDHGIEAPYQIWKRYDGWKLFKCRWNVDLMEPWQNFSKSTGIWKPQFFRKILWNSKNRKKAAGVLLWRACMPSLVYLRQLEVGQKSGELKRREKNYDNNNNYYKN